MKNIFTIDTEEWYHANYEDDLFQNCNKLVSTVEENIDRILELFGNNSVKATFFILGYVAEEHPQMVRRISEAGHEIASHGYAHQLVYKQTPKIFRADIRKSKELLEDIIGKSVLGYRAPSWSIKEESLWALEILEEEGFTYTSSIFPTKNFLYGIPYAPRFMHTCDAYGKTNLKIINIPPTTARLFSTSMSVPFSGGAYFRLIPYQLVRIWTDKINNKEKQPVIFYLHPREIDVNQPKMKLKLKDAMIHYYGINSCESKLEKILRRYNFCTIEEMLKER